MRHHELRRVHRAARRQAREGLHSVRRAGERSSAHDRRGSQAGRRTVVRAAGLQAGARSAVRLLYAGDDARRHRVARVEPGPQRGRRPLGHLRQPVSLHGLHEHREGDQMGRAAAPGCCGRARATDRHRRDDPRGSDGMTTTAEPGTLSTPESIGGIGHSRRRIEDDRFVQGGGRYVDDITLPGMLHMAILRAPMAHARLVSIDTTEAAALPGVVAVVTGEMLAAHKLAWMPTLSGDTEAVLVTDKVRFQGQEVAAVIATDPYVAWDALDLIDVDYEQLPAVVTPQQALSPDAPLIRDDKEGQKDNRSYTWESGDKAATDAAFAKADVVVSLDTHYPRSHPSPLETCGCVADVNAATGHATVYMTSQAPHVHRTLFAMVAGLPEQNIRIVSPDIGGGFGNKVPIYPGYVIATAASLLIGKPVKWVETRTENLISTGFARDYYMHGELALDRDGKMLALRVNMLSDNGAFYADAQPTKFRAGLFHIVTGSYDLPTAHVVTEGAYTNKAPGGVAYRCSFRVTEASYLIERLVQNASYELEIDPAELRMRNFIKPEQFPYHSATGFVYDSGDYPTGLQKALDAVGYQELRAEQAVARAEGRLMGIGIASFTEVVGAGHGKDFDIAGLKMFDSAELRVHPTGKAILKLGVKSQGQGHETTFAQIVANELGIPAGDITVREGDTDDTPYGLGTYASRSTPVGGAATAVIARKLRDKARVIAAHLLEASAEGARRPLSRGGRPGRGRGGVGVPRSGAGRAGGWRTRGAVALRPTARGAGGGGDARAFPTPTRQT